MNAPTATVIEARANQSSPGAVVATVICPLCSKRHTHGGRSLQTVAGHRAADCGGRGGYMVQVPEHIKIAR